MFRSFDKCGGYNIENPVLIDSLWDKYHDSDDDEEILFDVDMIIGTSRLDIAEENHLVNAIEDASYSRGDLQVDCADVDLIIDEDDGEKWNKLTITGYVKENALDKIYDLLNNYDVDFIKDKVKEI